MKRALWTAPLILLMATPARADVSLGANFGGTVSFREGVPGGRFALGWPYSHASGLGATPGIRFGFTGGAGRHEGYIDSTFAFYSRSGDHVALITGNYQYNFEGRANTFFVTGGGGPLFFGNDTYSATAFMFGGGVGFRQRIADGHGTMREELRLDFIPSTRAYPQTVMVGIKLGFDLWFR